MLAVTVDPNGRRVVLREERWRHVKREHPELAPLMREIMRAVREPDRRAPGRRSTEEWFFLEGVGPAGWLQVVVHFEGAEGWITTAFPRTAPPG